MRNVPCDELAAVPWIFTGGMWRWTTRHFRAQIIDDGRGCAWLVEGSDVPADGVSALVREGRAATFPQAETAVRELVGKLYRADLGYARFAGALACTHVISGGRRVDFSDLQGRVCVLTVTESDGKVRRLVGVLSCVGDHLQISAGVGPVLAVQPASIIDVIDPHPRPVEATRIRARVFRGQPTPTCTGVPGWEPGTVNHHGPICPVHETDTRVAR